MFDPYQYSRFKYGDVSVAYKYANGLADLFIKKGTINKNKQYFLCGSAYKEVPTAAVSIAKAVTKILLQRGYKITFFRIHGRAFAQDYSELSVHDRNEILSKIPLSVDKKILDRIRNSNVLVIDDIQITGLHKRALERFLISVAVREVVFSYVAILSENYGLNYPQLEWDLNHYYVDSLIKIRELISKSNFTPNSRVCKFILASEPHLLAEFTRSITSQQLNDLIVAMKNDGYDEMLKYRHNFAILEKLYAESITNSKNAYPVLYAYQN
jgi:KaiC/GvpD/RAD55 family RecA-like ATPase